MRKTVIACSLLGVCAFIAYVRQPAPVDSHKAASSEPVASAATVKAAQSVAAETTAAAAAPAPSRKSEAAKTAQADSNLPKAQALGDVIVGLNARPADWRSYNPEVLTLHLFDGTTVSFRRVAVTDAGGHVRWIGRSDVDEGWVTVSADRDGWTAAVSFAEGNGYRVSAGTRAVVSEFDPSDFRCALPPLAGHDITAGDIAGDGAVVTTTDVQALTEDASMCDVAFLYDGDTETNASAYASAAGSGQTPAAFIENALRSAIDMANVYLANSAIDTMAWRYAGLAKIPAYSTNGDLSLQADIDILKYGTTPASQFAAQFFVDQGADQLMLIVGGARSPYDGLGSMPGHYSVVRWRNGNVSPNTVAHELAHNFGCDHDRETVQAPDNNSKYNYGHVLTVNGVKYGTIMSYIGIDLGYFSNPEVSYQGVPTGLPVTDPKAAFNVKVLRDGAAKMASYQVLVGAPKFSAHPVGGSLTVGQSYTMSIGVIGRNLTFQWFKDGVAIAGATNPIYTISSAQQSDAGVYKASATNSHGTITSNEATVSVSTATTPTTPGTSDGGGGGGGAPSLWFVAALSLLFALRHFLRKSGRA